MIDEILLQHLIDTYKTHGKIIVGVDFDNTVHNSRKTAELSTRCENVREILKSLGNIAILCLYTVVNSPLALDIKVAICKKNYGLNIEYVNESPIFKGSTKPYFNILLDDKAGLDQALATLIKFQTTIDE